MWRGLEVQIRAQVVAMAEALMARGLHWQVAPIVADAESGKVLFTDSETFISCCTTSRWNGLYIVLVLDELDVLLNAPVAFKSSFLNTLRTLKIGADLSGGRPLRAACSTRHWFTQCRTARSCA
jgi:hypothetical protein